MEKQKKWQLFLIVAVVALTVYNILPTLFFYSKPLKSPIDTKRASVITENLVERINSLESHSQEWILSFCSLLHLETPTISLNAQQPEFVSVAFQTLDSANTFRTYLPRAGALIPFVPAQLSVYDPQDTSHKTVVVQRKIPVHFDPQQTSHYAQFSQKFGNNHEPTLLYQGLVEDRALQVGIALAGASENALKVQSLGKAQEDEVVFDLAESLLEFSKAYGESSPISARYFATFTQVDVPNRSALVQQFISAMEKAKERAGPGSSREKTLDAALKIVRRNQGAFASGHTPMTFPHLDAALKTSSSFSLKGNNPFFETLLIDWSQEKIILKLYPDVVQAHNDQLLYNAVASLSRLSGETLTPHPHQFEISLSTLTNSNSFIALKLSAIASAEVAQIQEALQATWRPEHPDLKPDAFPVYDYETYRKLSASEQRFGLVLYSPALSKTPPPQGFRMNSLYVIAKGMDQFIQRLKTNPHSELSYQFSQDFNALKTLLQKSGFTGYSGDHLTLSPEFANDFIFECEDYYQTVLKASREDFSVHGTKRYAVLELTDLEQRILTENKIDNHLHEDLLKWRDDYYAAQLGIRGVSKYDVPKPTRSVLWSNFMLSWTKYFRGDDRKILHWGLDLSGGKTVHIELRDAHNRVVTNEFDLKQGVNELYNRVNKMGVSEVSIRQEGNFITLDFPGSQGLSAAELIKASSMTFHIINEQFGPYNASLAPAVSQFLQEVWNEAVVTGRKQVEEINLIACKHLYGEALNPLLAEPQSESARLLYQQGLRLAQDDSDGSSFNDTLSALRLFRGQDFTDWQGQTHPLVIVFRHFALQGAELENISASYDPSKGNFLSFSVQGAYTDKEGHKISPRDNLFAWTSVFSKEKIAGTPLQAYSQGKGWRMAVILNDSIISSPTLDSALRDSAMITGSFTQREITQLETDLKAGSLSFTPHILSEKNVSPELGAKERKYGIIATLLSLTCVIAVMVGYYRFGGLVASVAVLFNLLLMWATLQNLQATMTLAGIAGIILTLAMAVDANVLVFERIREEFAKSGRIAAAVHVGYRKALSAILDSNVTTMIAAMILLHFDSGPIKALAIMLIIGILSSLFTALFMTRFFFTHWVQNPKNTCLNMLHWFQTKNFNFLQYTKKTVLFSALVIILGGFMLIKERSTILGMDFSGGYALTVELQPQEGVNYRALVEEALSRNGATSQDVQIRELTPSNTIRIFLSRSLQQAGRPFFNMPLENEIKEPLYSYEINPKIVWLVNALNHAGAPLTPTSLSELSTHWTEVSGQMSDTMRNNALIGLIIALICILIYITIRFEFKYAISATVCLAHDLVFTLAAIALLHALGVNVQIDLNTVAALLTIVGYSLNDTIIIFDRIREDVRLMRSSSFFSIINHALNVTLSRTIMTSGMTLLVLIPLILLGGPTLFGFSLVMAIGVIFGTLSSLFIAAPLMKYFHDRESHKAERRELPEKNGEHL